MERFMEISRNRSDNVTGNRKNNIMVNKELIIHVSEDLINIALLEGGQLVELHKEEHISGYSVGDIYLGKVRKTMSGLNAAFINIGHPKDAFLHYLDLGSQYKSLSKLVDAVIKKKPVQFGQFRLQEEIKRNGRINDFLSAGQNIMVQVIKEAISTKGPRVSTEISLTGRHVVLLPFNNKIALSQKIRSGEERKRLKRIVEEICPSNFGVIVRTAAQGKEAADIESDIASLLKRWNTILDKLKTAPNPSLLMSEETRVNTILRDMLNDSFSDIYVDDSLMYNEIRNYVRQIAPEKEKIVKLYKGTVSIFDNFDITRQIKGLFGKLVPFKRKAYMIIEHTEALHVIDINSGPRMRNADSQDEIALEVNLNAIPVIARQLRLRDMGGIIVIDFIDLHKNENKEKVFHAMREAMANDRARHTILPLSKFGLMQITRQRVRPETKIENKEQCPACRGTGKISPSILFDTEIENQIAFFVEEQNCKYIKLIVHPYIAAYIRKGVFSLRMRWMWKFKAYIKVIADESVGYVDAKYYDRSGYPLTSHTSLFEADDREGDEDIEEENEG